ncbi:MAG: DUF502 domain-containing protein [Rhodospirillales bacterium]|nr:MAG: DUF502 domain-containing protein [Rhodospirillales bacterium]
MAKRRTRARLGRVRRNLIAGLFTFIPIWVTWLILNVLFRLLSDLGGPAAEALAVLARPYSPEAALWFASAWFRTGLAIALMLVLLFVLGWLATWVLGRRLLKAFDELVGKVPFVRKVYGSTKQLVDILRERPGRVRRVVLIDFPSPEMKTVGFVTRTLTDQHTGEELAAVYVPTTPNPTSGYLEIVPVSRITPTEWSLDEAMTFVISGGAVGPDRMTYNRP